MRLHGEPVFVAGEVRHFDACGRKLGGQLLQFSAAAVQARRQLRGLLFRSIEFRAQLLRWRFRRLQLIAQGRSEEHTSELQSLMRISYAVFCLKKKSDKTITHL